MREATDKRKEIEKEHTETLNLLKEQQWKIQKTVTNSSEKSKAYEVIETLQSKIRELEKKAELQNVLHEELALEMAAIKRSAAKAASMAASQPQGATSLPHCNWGKHMQETSMSPDSMISSSDMNNLEQTMPATCNSLDNHIEQRSTLKRQPYGVASTAQQPAVANEVLHLHPQQNITSEIDSIMEKIDHDNRILAELDKSRFTIGQSGVTSRQLPVQPKMNTSTLTSHTTTSNVNQSTTLPVSGLTNVTDTLSRHGLPGTITTVDGTTFLVPGTTLLGQGIPTGNPTMVNTYPIVLGTSVNTNPLRGQHMMVHSQPRMMPQIPTIIPQFDIDSIEYARFILGMYGTFPDQHLTLGQDSKMVDMLDIPGKGRCYVYIARYSYDPFVQSPNDCPEAELAVNAGDYILVWGNMDEDGFFDGELLDGRRGLVPSNFVQKLVGDDLLDFHQSVVQVLRDCDDSVSTNIPPDLDYNNLNSGDFFSKRTSADFDLADILEEEEEEEDIDHTREGQVAAPKQLTLERQLNKSILIGWNPPDSPSPQIDCYHVYVDRVLKVTVKATERTRALVEGVDSNRPHRISVRSVTVNRRTSRDAACTMVIGKDVPLGPTNVKAGRVTATSAVISWLPSNSNYQHTVCVNNVELRTVKPGVYRHTITGLAPNTVYRVTVRAKNIRAPHFDEKANIPIERYACHIDFRTLPKGCKEKAGRTVGHSYARDLDEGLPEPPVDIQVEPGPQDGTLLVTWQPSTSISSPAGTLVTGYAVYADGKKVTDVDSPSGDHALIDINKLLGLNPKQVTVRTKSRDNQSSDSLPTQIPPHILKGKQQNGKGETQGVWGYFQNWLQNEDKPLIDSSKILASVPFAKQQEDDRRTRYGSIPPHMRHQHRPGQVIETEENLSDKEIYPNNHMSIPAIEITKDTGSEGNFSEEDYLDRRSGGRGHFDTKGGARGRPHHRQDMAHHPRHHRRDERDQFYMDRGEGKGRFERERERERERDRMPVGGFRNPRGNQPPPPQNPRDKRTRLFVALFDYDPEKMSPNPDACEEELPFLEGDTIKVFGDKDADGFYWGECKGQRGFVPHNMVIEMQGMDGGPPGQSKDHRDRDRWADIYANMPVKKMIALYDYDAHELSPNVDAEQVELSFKTGNIIYVYGDMDDDGFYMGELDGVRGLVPSNFLTEAPPEYNTGPMGPGSMKGGRPQQRPQMDRGHGPGARGPPPPPRTDQRGDRRKDACPVPQVEHRQDGRAEKEGNIHAGARTANVTRKYQAPPNPQIPPTTETKPIGNISSTQQHTSEAPAPNLMQKLSEMTAGDNSVDHILSKGKELIFMKFGLGK
ncbi:peripheral-type benzodiazepine receptor-associated protein 1 isoform X4 [Cimex lectularius]|uniref:RIMS-binding protein 2 n=1 Tax=Cimex lectularius TaxID=79782 RepID=A0A8I6SMJ1_CIMLE|nr:peripheral-type benzodiazepine receptor-associated protein 1 isoform X4 [Cimex lectularius]